MSIISDHIGGNFQWARAPSCCDRFKDAIDDRKFFFVANMVDEDSSIVYMVPTGPDGSHATSKGIVIEHCPFCGTKVSVRKKK